MVWFHHDKFDYDKIQQVLENDDNNILAIGMLSTITLRSRASVTPLPTTNAKVSSGIILINCMCLQSDVNNITVDTWLLKVN